MAPYRAILRYYRCDTHIARSFSREVSTPPTWGDTPLGTSFTQAHLYDTPFCNVSRKTIVRYPIKIRVRPKERPKASCGETVVQKGVFGESRFFSAPLSFSLKTPERSSKPLRSREETDSPKTPFWTTVSPHDPFAAPLTHSEKKKNKHDRVSRYYRCKYRAI